MLCNFLTGLSNPANLLEGNRVFVGGVDAGIRLENRGVIGLSAALPKDVKAAALDPSYRSTNFKGKPQGAKGGIRDNVVHSSNQGLLVKILQNTFSDRARCVAQLRPGSSFLLSALKFL